MGRNLGTTNSDRSADFDLMGKAYDTVITE